MSILTSLAISSSVALVIFTIGKLFSRHDKEPSNDRLTTKEEYYDSFWCFINARGWIYDLRVYSTKGYYRLGVIYGRKFICYNWYIITNFNAQTNQKNHGKY